MSYKGFAYIYDSLIGEDYGLWADYIEDVFKKYGRNPSIVLDLACGTGSVTELLARRGYDMIGLDASPEMLSVAESKRDGLPIRYICQDMTNFELYGTADAVISTLDGVNYITDMKRLVRMMKLVNNYLNPGGLFVFDISSEYKISQILGNNSFVFEIGDIFYTWENFYSKKSRVCQYNLTFFIRNGEKYERIDECQKQRAYSREEIEKAAGIAGLQVLGCFGALGFDRPRLKSERINFVLAKNYC